MTETSETPAPSPDSVYAEALSWYREHWDPTMALGDWWNLLADAGWSYPSWPIGLGGRGLSSPAAKAAERARTEVGAYGPPAGIATFLAAPTILAYGTDEQKQRFLPGIIRGRNMWCQLFSEPGSGSDLAGMSTRAVRDGDEWLVTGQKVWNSGAQFADYAILMARTDPEQPKHRGITYFLIDMSQPGVEVRGLREMTGDVAFNEVFLADARVADSDRLGEVGEGWRVAMTTLAHERDPANTGLGAGAGFAKPDLDVSVEAHARSATDKVDGFALALSGGVSRLLSQLLDEFRVSDDPLVRQKQMKIFEMRRTSRWSGQRAVAAVKAGAEPGPGVSTLKLLGSEIGRQTRDLGLEAMGATGMLWGEDTPEKGSFHAYAMFTPAMSIAGGSDQIQRNIIGERVLGLPREPGEAEQRQQPWSELPRN